MYDKLLSMMEVHGNSVICSIQWYNVSDSLTRKLYLSEARLTEKSFVPTKVGIEIKRL